MKSTVKLAKIGNSKGIRLSKQLLQRYQINESVEIETTSDSIILRPLRDEKLDWASTYKQMADAAEDWTVWDAVAEEGLNELD
ncbi:AbrB/MazE/SpoVT family DNA-binding domain-containing protein [Opitutales bacterium]|jgi:antitoxin MazE|nr:AbrB/MazE/SpoVT family DNA-binding domain-containing protein [Opitutales bacterium]